MNFGLDHLGIAVKSLNSAKRIYEKLGLSVSEQEEVPAEKVRLVMIPVGQTRLELLEPTSDDSAVAKFIAKRGEGMHHVCLRVPDLTAAVQKLKADMSSCILRVQVESCLNSSSPGTEHAYPRRGYFGEERQPSAGVLR